MKKFFTWIIAFAIIIWGLMGLTSSWYLPKIFAGCLILVGILISPKIKFRIKPLFSIIMIAICSLGIEISDNYLPEPNNDEAKEEVTYYVNTDVLNVREGAGTEYQVLFKLIKDDKVKVISKEEYWCKISTKEGEGYVAKDYLSNKKGLIDKFPNWEILILIIIGLLGNKFIKGSSKGPSRNKTKKMSSTSVKKTDNKVVSGTPPTPKIDSNKLKHICKYCGAKSNDVRNLVGNSCPNSPSGKHVAFKLGIQDLYICKNCGVTNTEIRNLTNNTCPVKFAEKHIPFEGGIQSSYSCKYCGFSSSNLKTLTGNTCRNSPTGYHEAMG